MGNTGIAVPKNEYNNCNDWYGVRVKDAQKILNAPNETMSSEQWQQLSQKLYKSTIESSYMNGNFIGNATGVVLEWNQKTNIAKFIRIIYNNSEMLVSMLEGWQIKLYEIVKKRKQTISVLVFGDCFWVVVKKPSTNLVFKYSKDYVSMFDIYPDLKCDFLVLGEEQLINSHIPSEAIMLEGY